MNREVNNIRIAICDDQVEDQNRIMEMTRELDLHQPLDIVVFSDSRSLLEAVTERAYDLILLDIEMKSPNGFETGRILSQSERPSLVIFITKSAAYTVRGYGIAFRYLIKPLDPDLFREAMEAAICYIHANRLTLECKEERLTIPIHQIMYLESQGHYLYIHTPKQCHKIRMRIDEAGASLPGTLFLEPHKSYRVNAEYIMAATATTITLQSGEILPISRSKRESFKAAFNCYLGL